MWQPVLILLGLVLAMVCGLEINNSVPDSPTNFREACIKGLGATLGIWGLVTTIYVIVLYLH